MAGISMHPPVGSSPTAALSYAGPQTGLNWSSDRHELHARFRPVNVVTELLYGTFGLLMLLGLLAASLLLASAGLLNRMDATQAVSALALGLPLAVIWALLATQCAVHLVRRMRHHNAPTILHANRARLSIICPTEWADPVHSIAAENIRRFDVYVSGFDLSLSRIVYLRVWTGDDYRATEIRFSTRDRDLPERLHAALTEVLRHAPGNRSASSTCIRMAVSMAASVKS